MILHWTGSFLAAGGLADHLKDWDIACFIKVNVDWTGAFGDFLLPLVRDQRTWYPFYLLLMAYVIVKFKWKSLPFILLAVAAVASADLISSHFLKDFVGRIRPCHEERLAGIMKLRVGYCPNSGSFTSSHAVNHFSLATFFYACLKPYFRQWAWLFFLWAALICYAQVYVGVHYPGDVLGGAVLGTGLGLLFYALFRKYYRFEKNLFYKKGLQ